MVLNKYQRIALALWIGKNVKYFNFGDIVSGLEQFCDGKDRQGYDFREWRVIQDFDFAGKIWNSNDKIYITGYCRNEFPKGKQGDTAYQKQQDIINKMNDEIQRIMEYYKHYNW